MTGLTPTASARLVIAVVLDTSQELFGTAMLPQLSAALVNWADAARAEGRHGRARVVFVGGGEPASALPAPGAATGTLFSDLAAVVAPTLSTAGPPRWTEAVRLAVQLCEPEAVIAGGDAKPPPILVFLVDDVSLPKLPPGDLAAFADLGQELGRRSRNKREVYVLAAGHHRLDPVSEKLVPESYFEVDALGFDEAFQVLALAVDVLAQDGGTRLHPRDVYARVRDSWAERRRSEPMTTAKAGLSKARPLPSPPPAPVPERRASGEPEVTRYVPEELAPLKYGPSRRATATAAVMVTLLVAVVVFAWLVGTGRPGLAVAALGVFVVLAVGVMLAVRE